VLFDEFSDFTQFTAVESMVRSERNWVKPELGLVLICFDVDMR